MWIFISVYFKDMWMVQFQSRPCYLGLGKFVAVAHLHIYYVYRTIACWASSIYQAQEKHIFVSGTLQEKQFATSGFEFFKQRFWNTAAYEVNIQVAVVESQKDLVQEGINCTQDKGNITQYHIPLHDRIATSWNNCQGDRWNNLKNCPMHL